VIVSKISNVRLRHRAVMFYISGTAIDREFTRLLSSSARKLRIPPSSWLSDTRAQWLRAKEEYDFRTEDGSSGGSGFASKSAPASATYTVDVTDVLDEWKLLEPENAANLTRWKENVVAAAARHGTVNCV
jgi:hypothetical protein